MSNSGSRSSSTRGSPYGSHMDLMDEEQYVIDKKRRHKRSFIGGVDLDDAESVLRKYQNETTEYTHELNNLRTQSQHQSRKIHDLQLQFEEARVRIDKLLQRKSRHSDYDFDRTVSSHHRTSVTSVSEEPSNEDKVHKTQVTVNPSNRQQKFAPVQLTLQVDE